MDESVALKKINETFRNEEDLQRIISFREDCIREKHLIDSQLKIESQQELEHSLKVLNELRLANLNFKDLRDNIAKINVMKNDSFQSIANYDLIERSANVYEFFEKMENIYDQFSTFSQTQQELERLIDLETAEEIQVDSPVTSLLVIHYRLNQLRDLRDELTLMSEKSKDDTKAVLKRLFSTLDPLVARFDVFLQEITTCLIESMKEGNFSLIIRLVKIIDFEEREDLKLTIFQSLLEKNQESFGGDSGRKDTDKDSRMMKSSIKRTKVRGYKNLFFDWIQSLISEVFDNCIETFQDNPFEVLENLDWVFQDLKVVQESESLCFPQRWGMFKQIRILYQANLQRVITNLLNYNPETYIIIQILQFDDKYRSIMRSEFGLLNRDIGSSIGEETKEQLLDDYLKMMKGKMSEWINRVEETERDVFTKRETAPQVHPNELPGLVGSSIVFEMFQEQCGVAAETNQAKILNGVVLHFADLLLKRQGDWSALLTSEVERWIEHTDEIPDGLIEYIVALANDQIRGFEYTEDVLNRMLPLVSKKYQESMQESLDKVMDGYASMGRECVTGLTSIMFSDIKNIFPLLFNKDWYDHGREWMTQLIDTFDDYLADFQHSLNETPYQVLLELLIPQLLLKYLAPLGYGNNFNMKKVYGYFQEDAASLVNLFAKYVNGDEVLMQQFEILNITLDLIQLKEDQEIVSAWRDRYLPIFNDLPTEFLRTVLSCRKDISSSRMKFIIGECEFLNQEYERTTEEFVPSFMANFVADTKDKKRS
ncbi:unnamed protein product [Kuraishia capsulata CBS 1993]|uniref:Uncharacterized protein n=1 Tax=Kuraishia capsulata CBS 1993 TaxID=1382522 RepID=W6MFZ0_9ASCO|nr:uncharacterized protein KUCA_T00000552001 [Kuraishia capsulata CBS 1993]CDK24586.1 unnamed protein product [Kuraishia capsulata CBS 1993]